MFMEAQVPAETPGGSDQPQQPAAEVAPTPTPAPAQSGASDSKGWTVFMEKPIVAAGDGAAQPSEDDLAAPAEQSAQAAAEEQQATAPAGVSKQTLLMDEAPEITASREPSAPVQTSVPMRPAVEAGGPGQQDAQAVARRASPAPPPEYASPTEMVPRESSKTMVYVAVTVAVIVIVIIVLAVI